VGSESSEPETVAGSDSCRQIVGRRHDTSGRTPRFGFPSCDVSSFDHVQLNTLVCEDVVWP